MAQLEPKINYYGQFDPPLDQLLYERYFKNRIIADGVAVECGAADGRVESTCYFFEESLGWLVYNVEASPVFHRQLNNNRPHAVNCFHGLGPETQTKTFRHVVHPEYGHQFGNGSFEHTDPHKRELDGLGCSYETFPVEVKKISDFFVEHQITAVDLFVLDVEGFELEVLSDLKNVPVMPKVFCVEAQPSLRVDINRIMEQSGYYFDVNMHNNMVFVHKSVSFAATLQKPMNRGKLHVTVATVVRQNSHYVNAFCNQIRSIIQDGFIINHLAVGLDGKELRDENLIKLSADYPCSFIFEGEKSCASEFDFSERSRNWASIANMTLAEASRKGGHYTFFVESDLTTPPDLLLQLLRHRVPVVAPTVMLGGEFYDSWGFRKLGGEMVTSVSQLKPDGNGPLFELSSVGSCLLIENELLHMSIRLPGHYPNGLLVGFCENLRRFGAKIYCDTSVSLIHPTSFWQQQIWTVKKVLSVASDTGGDLQQAEISIPDYRIPANYSYFYRELIKEKCLVTARDKSAAFRVLSNANTRTASLFLAAKNRDLNRLHLTFEQDPDAKWSEICQVYN